MYHTRFKSLLEPPLCMYVASYTTAFIPARTYIHSRRQIYDLLTILPWAWFRSAPAMRSQGTRSTQQKRERESKQSQARGGERIDREDAYDRHVSILGAGLERCSNYEKLLEQYQIFVTVETTSSRSAAS